METIDAMVAIVAMDIDAIVLLVSSLSLKKIPPLRGSKFEPCSCWVKTLTIYHSEKFDVGRIFSESLVYDGYYGFKLQI